MASNEIIDDVGTSTEGSSSTESSTRKYDALEDNIFVLALIPSVFLKKKSFLIERCIQCGHFMTQQFQTELYTHFYLGYKNIKKSKSSSTFTTSWIIISNFFSNVRK